MPTQLWGTQMPAQVSWPRSPIFSGVRCLVPHPSELGCPDAQPSLWSVGTSPAPQARAGRGNRLCQPHCPANPGSCLLPSAPWGQALAALP